MDRRAWWAIVYGLAKESPLGDMYNVRMFGGISYFELIWIVVSGRKEE